MGKAPKAMPIVVVDTREQLPFLFDTVKPLPGEVVKATLTTGDYSIQGLEKQVCVERKSHSDLFGSCGSGRDRFEREFQRMAEMEYAALVIEQDWKTMFTRPAVVRMPAPDDPGYSGMAPESVLGTLIAWSQRYRVHIWACPGRPSAERMTWRLLYRFWRDFTKREKHKA